MAAAWLAALCMIGTLVMVLLSITGRLLDFNIRGTDAYAGYFMAAAGFLALGHTLQRGEHIRVTVLLQSLSGGARRGVLLLSIGIAVLLAVVFAWYSVSLAWQSYTLHDVSASNDATPLWIPQIPMAIGTVIFAIAVIDTFVAQLHGRDTLKQDGEIAHSE